MEGQVSSDGSLKKSPRESMQIPAEDVKGEGGEGWEGSD